jgi:hypothetical protein
VHVGVVGNKSIYFGVVRSIIQPWDLICMSQKDLICLILAILGVVLFLYGSNYYSAIVGWSGVFLVAAALLAEVALEVYAYIRKREVG